MREFHVGEFHTAVIGAGSGGLTVAVGLAGLGKKVALVEKKYVGGDCTNVGCVPSKTLIHLANHAQGVSPAEILAKVREHRDELRIEETEWVKGMEHVSFFEGEARFEDANTLAVALDDGGTETVRARHIVIATGSVPVRIPLEGLPEEKTLTNESLFDLENLPEHLVIVGGGIIGCEMAFAFHKLGSRVSVVDLAERVLSPLEPEVSELISQRFDALGVDVYLKAKGSRFDDATGTLFLDQEGREVRLEGVDKVLLAVGRKPQLELGLDKVGLQATKRGLPVNAWGRTAVKSVYAVGDVNPNSAFTHSANAEGRRLVQKLAFPYLPVGEEPVYPSATFTSPEVSQVGPTLAELRKRFHPSLVKTYRVDLKDTDRGYTQFFGPEDGFVLVHALRLTGRVLSATVVAHTASEMIPLLTHAVNNRVTMFKLSGHVFPYPTLSEAVKKAASNYTFETLPNLPREAWAYLSHRWRSRESEPTPARSTPVAKKQAGSS